MQLTSIVAIYVLFWVIAAFIILPIGIRSHHETGVKMMKGQSDGAPVNFRPWRVLLLTTLLATAMFGLFYLNYVYGWVTMDDIDFFNSRDRMQ
jgi:predicted secreted protein|tara:strand:- start:326 stop:604 length:279 start_codon:yes stop_codon:yes gene_type:complete